MRSPKIWFDRGLSQTADAARLVSQAEEPVGFDVLVSHTDPTAPGLHLPRCTSFLEPEGLDDHAYVDWALQVCMERGINLLVPGRRLDALAAARVRFAAIGTRLVIPIGRPGVRQDPPKTEVAILAATLGIPVPEGRLVASPAEFDAAYDELSARHASLCVKPDNGIFGSGFRRLDPEANPFEVLHEVPALRIDPASYRMALAAARGPVRVIVGEYLPGIERSIDCLAHRGKLVCAISRAKRGRSQHLDGHAEAIGYARRLTDALVLDGLVNIQFRDDAEGRPRLLEVNPRMSGGLPLSCDGAGLNLPYWSALLALDLAVPQDVPRPITGWWVAPGAGALVWTEPDAS